MPNENGVRGNGVYSWDRWAIYIVESAKKMDERQNKMDLTLARIEDRLNENIMKTALLKQKVGVIAAIAALLGGAIATAIVNIIMHV